MDYTIPFDQVARRDDLPLLAKVGEATYHELHLVIERQYGQGRIYCLRADWENSNAAKDARIAELEHEVAELRRQVADAQRVPPTVAAAATGLPAPDGRPGVEEASATETHTCPELGCDRSFASAKALSGHRAKKHGAWKLDLESPPELPPDVEPPWICAQRHTATHARSLTDPARCMRCVATPATTNGHPAAAIA